MVAVVCPSSVVHDYISKTKQDRPIVTIEHCYEVGMADSVAISSARCPGEIFGFLIQNMCKY